jgi:hypothetical protein
LWGIKNNFLKVDDFKGIISLIYIIKISWVIIICEELIYCFLPITDIMKKCSFWLDYSFQ